MGWFLTGRKVRGGRRVVSSSRQRHKQDAWDPVRTWRGLKILILTVTAAVVAVGWPYTERRLSRYAAAHAASAVDPGQVELVDAPRWMNHTLQQELCRRVAGRVGGDPLNHDGVEQAARDLSSSPWVQRVNRVQRCSQGRVRVHVQFHQPVAVALGRDGYHLVSDRGVRLPGLYLRHQLERLGLPLIVGMTRAPRNEGQVWPGADLQAGISLVQLLADQPYLQEIQSIDVSGRDERGRIRLVLRTRSGMVRWGLPPGTEEAIEPDPYTKRRRLEQVYRQRGSIDAGGKVVDVYGPAVFVHQQVTWDDHGAAVGYTSSW